jgi:parallel beta-helix repeat protein
LKNKTIIAITELISILILIGSSLYSVNAQMGHYYIRSDGSLDPSTLPIQHNGDTYTLTEDLNVLNAGIIIQKSGIVFDGAGHTLNGSNVQDSAGILITGNSDITVKNLIVKNFYYGFYVTKSNNDLFSTNTVENNFNGFYIYRDCNSTTIEGNKVRNNNNTGIWIRGSDYYSKILGNTITDNHIGLSLSGTTQTAAYHNNFENNEAHVILDMAYGNKWDSGSPGSGNYWGGYNGTDANNDGSGDAAYKITQYYNDKDNYPLMETFVIPEFPAPLIMITMLVTVSVLMFTRKKKPANPR